MNKYVPNTYPNLDLLNDTVGNACTAVSPASISPAGAST